MKKIITIYAAILMTTSLFAQAPNKMSYQAVIRNTSGALVTSTSVGMQISILQGSASGTAVYLETQTPTSNANGLVSIEIGGGTVVSGNFATIDWATGPYFVKTETDLAGGTNYSVTGTSQLLSVPYALYAKNTDSWLVNGNTTYTFKSVGIGTSNPSLPLEVFTANGGAFGAIKIVRNNSTENGQFALYPNNYLYFKDADDKVLSTVLHSFAVGASSIALFARIGGGISENIAGQEKGFITIQVADGTGNWGVSYEQEKIRITNERTSMKNLLNLQPQPTAPNNPIQGDIYFDNTLNKLRVYDGTTWQNCW